MVVDWLEFVLNVVGGAMAFLCLFEGVRRLGVQGTRRPAVLISLLGFTFFAIYGAFAYWRYVDITDTLAIRHARPPATQAPADRTRARASFIASGLLAPYVERGDKKSFAPSQDDIRRRERMVASNTLLAATARASFSEALLWLILGAAAALSGFALSREKKAAPGA